MILTSMFMVHQTSGLLDKAVSMSSGSPNLVLKDFAPSFLSYAADLTPPVHPMLFGSLLAKSLSVCLLYQRFYVQTIHSDACKFITCNRISSVHTKKSLFAICFIEQMLISFTQCIFLVVHLSYVTRLNHDVHFQFLIVPKISKQSKTG